MNTERRKTRDRLLEYDDFIMPVIPHTAGLQLIYPWENESLNIMAQQLYKIASLYGFNGNVNDFFNQFVNGNLVIGTLNTFPVPGNKNNLYLDKDTEILYYFKVVQDTIYTDLAARIGVAIVGTHILEDTDIIETYIYIPVKAMPIENLIYDCGDTAEYID